MREYTLPPGTIVHIGGIPYELVGETKIRGANELGAAIQEVPDQDDDRIKKMQEKFQEIEKQVRRGRISPPMKAYFSGGTIAYHDDSLFVNGVKLDSSH